MEELTQDTLPTDESIDAAWNDEFEAETVTESMEPEAEADQPEQTAPQEQQKPTDTEPQAAEQTPAAPEQTAEQKPADQPDTFTLKHLDEVKSVGKDEVVALAQKGLDYDRIRERADELKKFRDEASPVFDVVRKLAQESGLSPAEFMDRVRLSQLMHNGISEETARAQLAVEKREAAVQAKEAEKQTEENQRQKELDAAKSAQAERERRDQARKDGIQRFTQQFPDVKADTIPPEVFRQAETLPGGLVEAYLAYQLKTQKAEYDAKLKNAENAKLSTGSVTTKGAASQADDIDRWWNEE